MVAAGNDSGDVCVFTVDVTVTDDGGPRQTTCNSRRQNFP